MPAPQLFGPYALLSTNVGLAVAEKGRAGVYGLGRIGANDKFHALYGYRSSPCEAFHGECELYHLLEPEDNAAHPERPDGSDWRCPLCRLFN